jgi:hypothetical protein
MTNIKIDKNLLKAIPFKDGIPEKLVKSRKEFRLPCHINLLKRTSVCISYHFLQRPIFFYTIL